MSRAAHAKYMTGLRAWASSSWLPGSSLLVFSMVQFLVQPRMTVNEGLGWDGAIYARLADTLSFSTAAGPFRFRVFMPLVVHSMPLPTSIADRFMVANLVFAAAAFLLLYVVLIRAFPAHKRGALVAWLIVLTSELSPIRMTFFYPAMTDPFHFLCITALLYLTIGPAGSSRPWIPPIMAFAICLLGGLNRENFFLYLPLLVPPRIRPSRTSIHTLIFGLSGTVTAFVIQSRWTNANVLAERGAGYLSSLFDYPFISVCTAVFMVGGSLLIFMSTPGWTPPSEETAHLPSARLRLTLALVLVAAIGGGANIERFLYWGMPILALMSVPHIERHFSDGRFVGLSIGLATHLVFQKVLFPIYASGTGLRGLPIRTGTTYSLLETLTGKSPALLHWVRFASPSMIVGVALAAVVIFALKATCDLRSWSRSGLRT